MDRDAEKPDGHRNRFGRFVAGVVRSLRGESELERGHLRPVLVTIGERAYVADNGSTQFVGRDSVVDELELLAVEGGHIRVVDTPDPDTDGNGRLCRIIFSELNADGDIVSACHTVTLASPDNVPVYVGKQPTSEAFPRIKSMGEAINIGLPADSIVVDLKPVASQEVMDSVAAGYPISKYFQAAIEVAFSQDRDLKT